MRDLPRPEVSYREVFVSSNARKTVPAGVLAHPSIQALVAQAHPSGTVDSDDVRRAAEAAGVEPKHLKALMAHLVGLGVTVAVPASTRAAAATTTRKTTTARAAKKSAPAKKAVPAKSAAKKSEPGENAPKAPARKVAAKAAEGKPDATNQAAG